MHTLTANAVCAMLAGLYLVVQFGYLGSRQLDEVRNFEGLLALNKPEKTLLGVEWLLVLIGVNILAVATPYADWSILALAVSTVGLVMLLVSTVVMGLHINGQSKFPVKLFAIDMVFFGAGFAVMWVSVWL